VICVLETSRFVVFVRILPIPFLTLSLMKADYWSKTK
jgi:hypothetical protein